MESLNKNEKEIRMKKTKKTSTTAFKMWHRTLALLLLILIAFSSASCNIETEQKQTSAPSWKEFSLSEADMAPVAPTETEELKYHEVLEISEEKIEEIKALYDQKIVPEKHTFSPGSQHSFEEGELELQTFGRFGNAYAIYAKNDYRGVNWEIIKGFEFRYTHATPYIYFNQEFYELGEAVEKGLIYKGDLETIHKSYKERNYDPYYKQYVIPKIDSSFYGKSVYVTVQPQYSDKNYTVEDFKETGCVNVEDVTNFSLLEEPNRIGRKWRLDLGKESKEWAIEVIKMLLERDDVFAAQTDYYNEYGND
jgi:hypothetical protein